MLSGAAYFFILGRWNVRVDGLRFVVLYPVPFSESASIDQQYAQSGVDLINRDQKVASAIDGPPTLQAIEKT